MKLVIIHYNAGNTLSVVHALHRLGVEAQISDDPATIREADKLIFPGVGEASSTMRYLNQRGLSEVIRGLRQPTLGICLGLQLMCAYSEENDTPCLGVFPERVKRFVSPPGERLKVPHMGWNTLVRPHGPLFAGITDADAVYFVHGYYAEVGPHTAAACAYGNDFSASLHSENFFALQFHPEKSGIVGQRILENFLKL